MEITNKREERGIWIREYTLWTRTQIAVLAYFSKYNNKRKTYREIARSYGRANYTDYKKACDKLIKRGYLERLKDKKYKVKAMAWKSVKEGKEEIIRSLPYFEVYLKKLNKRSKQS